MKNLITLLAVLCLAGAAPSCQSPSLISPQTNVAVSTYSVQAAEHTLRAAKDTLDLFFGLVKDNHELVRSQLPSVYAFAERMQAIAPGILRKANAAKNTFKYNRTPDNQANLDTIMKTVAQIMADVQANTKKLQTTAP